MNKRGFEFSFSWLFAIIVGAIILFIAIYAAGRVLKGGEYQAGTETAKKLTILFDPLGSQTSDAKSGKITLSTPIKMYENCIVGGDFGKQLFSTSEKQAFGEGQGEKGGVITIYNKYVFTRGNLEGKEFNYFSKTLEMPFKVADVLLVTSKSYCLLGAPPTIKEEIEGLGISNIIVNATTIAQCKSAYPEITSDEVFCFGGGCDNKIYDTSTKNDWSSGYVEGKDGKRKYFFGGLIYASIFSDRENYECNVKRLMMRLSRLSRLYLEKSKLLSINNVCDSGLDTELGQLADLTNTYSQRSSTTSYEALNIYTASQGVNQNSLCELW